MREVETEVERADALIRTICSQFPERRACSADERGAQECVRDTLADVPGAEAKFERFRWNYSLYSTMALHFGLATFGALIAPTFPAAGAFVLALAGISYWADSSRNGHILRSLQPRGDSQNLLVTLPATGVKKLRIVLIAHVDAAFTGWIFDPKTLKRAGGGRTGERQPYFARSLEMTIDAIFILALLALGRSFGWIGGPWLRAVELLLTIPPFIAFLVNLDVVRRDHVVPGAADNLSGVACCETLLRRFAKQPFEDVELVFAFTGAEEAGTGGAWALAKAHNQEWDTRDTVVLGVDTVCNGELRWFLDGEMDRIPVAGWLENLLRRTAASDPRFDGTRPFEIPAGATDVMPFLARGYTGVTVGCTDVEYGAPRHYHHPTDTPDNLDPAEVILAADFVEQLIHEVVAFRTA